VTIGFRAIVAARVEIAQQKPIGSRIGKSHDESQRGLGRLASHWGQDACVPQSVGTRGRKDMRRLVSVIGVLCWAGMVRADVVRSFAIDADQVVPPTASIAAGNGRATLNDTATELSFLVQHGVEQASQATANVRVADADSNGPVVFTLSFASSNSFSGVWSIDSNGVADFLAGRLYLQIETPSFPAGEIRGQIAINPDPQPGDVIITEIMYNPASQEGDGGNPPTIFTANPEWIELFNTTFTDIDISGWFFQDEDVDEANPCVPLRGGDMPEFILGSFEVVVVIPDGTLIGGEIPSVADFKAAWNLGPDDNVIQLLSTNGTAGGAIVGRNLSNNPVNDTFDINDLPLDASFWIPCDPLGFERPDSEILTLNDGTQIIDVVNYDDGFPFTSLWPDTAGFNSISLVPDDYPDATIFDSFTALGNDDGRNWIAHQVGDDALGFQQAAAVGVYGGGDVGSPCRLLGASADNLPPSSIPQQVLMSPGETEDIFMEATDRTRPFFGLLLFVIKSLPQNGQLIDVASNRVITEADVAGNGYLMPRIPFEQVRYINDGTCGADSFTFATNDGLLESQPVTVELIVQCGDVVITEIMYNPDSTEDSPSLAEWVELYNATDEPINLAGWYLADNLTRSGDFPAYILGAGSAVTAIPPAVDATEFATAWSAPFLQITTNGETGVGGAMAGSNLNNSGDALRLVRPGGPVPQVVDAAFYLSGFEDPAWPQLSPDGASIYVLPAAGYAADVNDDPASWAESVTSVDGAYAVTTTVVFNGFDRGSPGVLHNVIQGDCPLGGPLRDGNGDGAVDLQDFAHFALCHAGPDAVTPHNCGCYDTDLDGDVDLRDFSGMQLELDAPVGVQPGLIISEVIDGTLTGGEPKVIELTNCGDTAVELADYRIALYSNGSTSENFNSMVFGDMGGVLAPGASFVVANPNSGPGDSFLSIYGGEADLYDAVANGNGNDVYQLIRLMAPGVTLVHDSYGEVGVDGTGTAWEYTDSHASSQTGRVPNLGTFTPANWSFGGPGALIGLTPAQIAAATSAGTHTCE
jgi:hypothetical protein